jgi:hypothetical protein
MVKEPIKNRRANDGIPEDLATGTETLITGEQNRAFLIAARDELEEQVGALPINGYIAGLINDKELGLGWAGNFEPVLRPVLFEGLANL